MMKKLLMLVLVLCLTSASYAVVATVDIAVNGAPYAGESVMPSDEVTVVWNTVPVGVFGGYAGLNFDVSLGDYMADSFSTLAAPPLIGTTIALAETAEGMAVTGGNTGMPFPNGWMFEFTFHVPEVPYSTVIVLDTLTGGFSGLVAAPGADDEFPYAELHVAPEPMTIALLGLGGLFLRRRK